MVVWLGLRKVGLFGVELCENLWLHDASVGIDNPPTLADDFYWRSTQTILGDKHAKGVGMEDPQNSPVEIYGGP